MKYVTETGIILGKDGQILQICDGTPASVDFPQEDIQKYHRDNPGSVFCLAHAHPPQMYELSARDKALLKAWSIVTSPYPMRVATLAQMDKHYFKLTTYYGRLETKASWLMRGKEGKRKFEIIEESSEILYVTDRTSLNLLPWQKILIHKSYTIDND